MDKTLVNSEKKDKLNLSHIAAEVIKSGLVGFALFFSVLLCTMLLASLIGTQPVFSIGIDDVFLSSIGFVLMGLIKLLELLKQKLPS